jgi:hypothetical protein
MAAGGSGGTQTGGDAGSTAGGAGTGGATTVVDASASGGAKVVDAGPDASRPGEPDAALCPAGFGDCNRRSDDGCETNLARHPNHCGICERDCLGAECHDGRCDPIQLSTDLAQGLAVDAGGIYWTTTDAVHSASRDGGDLRNISKPEQSAQGIVLAGGSAYWTVLGNAYFPDNFTNPGLVRVASITDVDGSTPRTLYSGFIQKPLFELASGIAVDDRNVYWEMDDRSGTGSAFYKAPLAGGPPRRVFPDGGYIARAAVQFLKAHAGHLFGAGGFVAALQGSPVGGYVVRMGTDDGSFQKVWQSDTIAGIDLDAYGDYVYFTGVDITQPEAGAPDAGSDSKFRLYRLPVNGTTAEELWTEGGLGLAVDASGIYASTQHSLRHFALAGGAPTVMVEGQTPRVIVTDDKAVYWANFDTPGGIWKMAK